MPKGLSVKPIEPLIIDTFNEMYQRDQKVTAKEVRKKVRDKLEEMYTVKNLPSDWPGVSAVGKIITAIKKKMTQLGPDPEDRPWSVLALAIYDIPPEVLPTLLKYWAQSMKTAWKVDQLKPSNAEHAKILEEAKQLGALQPLTIRQAKWIGRLYHIYKERMNERDKFGERGLHAAAMNYANYERIMSLVGEYPEKPEDMRWVWQEDALLYYELTSDDELLTTLAYTTPELRERYPGLYQQIIETRTQVLTDQEEATNEGQHKGKE